MNIVKLSLEAIVREGQLRIQFDIISEKLGCGGLVEIVSDVINEYDK